MATPGRNRHLYLNYMNFVPLFFPKLNFRRAEQYCFLSSLNKQSYFYLGIKHLVQFASPHGNGFCQLHYTKSHIQNNAKIIGSHMNCFHKLLNECAELFGISFQFPPLRIQVCHIFILKWLQQL